MVLVSFLEPLKFGVIPVSQKVEKILRLRNKSKIPTVFEVRKLSIPEGATFAPLTGRIPSDDIAEITVTYMNMKNMLHPYKKNFYIDVVGSEPLQIPFQVQTKIPAISIEQEVIEFGTIKLGNRKKITMTITNKSNLEAALILDMRKKEDLFGIEGLEIEYVMKKGEKENPMVSLQKHPDEEGIALYC
jgi:hypothetical protein